MNINDAMSKSCPFKDCTCSYSCMAWEWINEEDVGGRCMLIPIPEEARGMPYALRVMRQYSRIDG